MLVIEYYGDAGAQEIITPGDTATAIAASTIQPTSGVHKNFQAKAILVVAEDFSFHFTLDGTAPTATAGTNVGITVSAGQSTVIVGYNNIKNFKIIDAVSGSASICKVQPFF